MAHDVDEVTVAHTAAPGTTAMVVAPDADPDTAGHQVDLAASPDGAADGSNTGHT